MAEYFTNRDTIALTLEPWLFARRVAASSLLSAAPGWRKLTGPPPRSAAPLTNGGRPPSRTAGRHGVKRGRRGDLGTTNIIAHLQLRSVLSSLPKNSAYSTNAVHSTTVRDNL